MQLTPGYAAFGDASNGPLSPGDVGKLTTDDRTSKPFSVKYAGKTYWYQAGAICLAGSTGGAIRVGDRVRVKASVTSPAHGWGSVRAGDVGTVASISGTKITVDFPSQSGWSGKLAEMEKQGGGAPIGGPTSGTPITDANKKVGVRVKRGPSWKWSNQDQNGPGQIVDLDSSGWVKVKWDHGKTNSYRTDHPDLVTV